MKVSDSMTVIKAKVLMRLSVNASYVADHTIATVKEALKIEGAKMLNDPVFDRWIMKHRHAIIEWQEAQNNG